jgi:hypothetical protein
MKIGVVEFFTVPFVATSQKTAVLPLWGTEKMENAFFMWKFKNTSYKSCRPCKYAHLHQKWDHDSNFAMELAQTMVSWLESQQNSCLVATFCEEFSMNPWHAMFSIFPRYYITYHSSMPGFSIF